MSRRHRAGEAAGKITIHATEAERLAIYLEVAAALRATGERGSEVAALLVEQLADELGEAAP